ncbi:MAG: MBL fold metallo-hydrolase [Oscillospiraceae bacterium]|nr:MBL fold metallo-hydrolase [Oscillospiraceae bacterium]
MLKIHTLTLGLYQTNCYIIHDENSTACAVIDPGYDAQRILRETQALDLRIEAILLTHGHFDHVGAVKDIAQAANCAVWMHQSDYSPEKHPMRMMLYPLADTVSPVIHFCEEGEEILAGGLAIDTLHTPGHTWGSVCYVCGDAMFSGDTLFRGACGRTDLPGGDWATILQSLQRLKEMDADLRVFPGHGEETTLPREKNENPYMR